MVYTFNAIGRRNQYMAQERHRLIGKRRRLSFVAGVVAMICGIVVWHTVTDSAHAGQPPVVYTTHAGDTVWSIAAKFMPNADPRIEVDRIISANRQDNTAATLVVGERLLIPVG